ncbi:MAG: MFS transporter [Desulfobacteraceae bacterium]|nr:MFS transporter [Desulfobacteraceae bacterium]
MKLPRFLQRYSGLNRSIYFLFLAQIVNSLGHFVHPFITLYLTQKMGMDVGLAGFYVFLSAVVWVPATLIGGRLVDRVARKKVMIGAQSTAAITLVPCAFLGTSIVVPWLLILSSFFQGIADPANDSMISDMTRPEERKAAFSLLYLGYNIGFSIGPMIAGFLFNDYLPLLFLGDAITTGIALVLVATFTRETKPSKEKIRESLESDVSAEKAEKGSVFSVLAKRPRLVAFMFTNILLSLVFSQTLFGLPLLLVARFGDSGPKFFGILMLVNTLTIILLTAPIIHVTDKLKPTLSMSLSGLFCALGFGFIHLFPSFVMILVLTVSWSIAEILSATNISTYIANHSPMTHRGRINAIVPLIMFSGHAVGPRLAGWFIRSHSVEAIWPIALTLSLSAAVIFYMLHLLER